jgi:hypothetical protein
MSNTSSVLEAAATSPIETMPLLQRLRVFSLPGGAEALRGVRGVALTLRGEIRSGPAARWMPFTAAQTIEATRSGFRWNARLRTGPFHVVALTVTDAYESGRGWMVVRAGGVLPVARGSGPDFDRGERQRYLAEIVACPPALFLNPSLEWTAIGASTLRVREGAGDDALVVDIEIASDGRPLSCRAERPRSIGKRAVVTPWSGTYGEPKEWEGLRVPGRLEAAWHGEDGPFTYVREEVISLVVLR